MNSRRLRHLSPAQRGAAAMLALAALTVLTMSPAPARATTSAVVMPISGSGPKPVPVPTLGDCSTNVLASATLSYDAYGGAHVSGALHCEGSLDVLFQYDGSAPQQCGLGVSQGQGSFIPSGRPEEFGLATLQNTGTTLTFTIVNTSDGAVGEGVFAMVWPNSQAAGCSTLSALHIALYGEFLFEVGGI